MKPSLYFIAFVLPEPSQTEITHFKLELFRKYSWKVALKSPAHITLIPPFHLLPKNESELRAHFNNYKFDSSLHEIKLNGFNHFGKRTIYVVVEPSELLHMLYKDLNTHFQKFYQNKNANRPKENYLKQFTPHVTIANRDIKPEQFNEAWQAFEHKNYQLTFSSDSFCLLKHNGQNWDVISEFSF